MAKKTYHEAGNLRLRTSVWAVASALALAAWPLTSEAAGLGKITVFSALGQPLRAELEVFATRDELAGMKAQLASPDAFRQAGVEYSPALPGITLSVDKRPNGQPVVRLTSTRPINDPFVGLLLELNWSTGRLIREYTFLLDPPEFAAKAAALPAIVKPFAAARSPADTRPPEERPARAPRPRSKEQLPSPSDGGTTYEVRRGETLSEIAREFRPDGVSLEQMLLGLFRANPDAFDRGNINRLKAGKILSIPDQHVLEAIPRAQARTAIVAQSADWGAYRRKLAAVAADTPGREEGTTQQAAGRITTRVEDKAGPAAEPKDQLRVSKTELADAKPLPAPRRSDEDLIAKEKALRDANERLATLERNVAELQKLLELKSQTLAHLEQQSGAVTTPASATPAAQPAPAPAAAAGGTGVAAQPPVPAAVAGVPATPPQTLAAPPMEDRPAAGVAQGEPGEPAKVDPPPAIEPAKAMEAPAPTPVLPPPPPEEPEFFEEFLGNPFVLAGSSGIIALLAAYWLIRRRRQGDGETPLASSTLAPVNDSLAARSVFRSTGGQSVDTSHSLGQTDFSQAGPGSIDTDEVDPVAEAEVYMAYGRDAQAEEILLEAKQKDPNRQAIHLKLLEIYHGRQDVRPFIALATELFAATGGNGSEWEKAAAMGIELDPRNPLFAAAGQTDAQPGGVSTPAVAPPVSLEDTFAKPGQLAQMVEAVGAAPVGPVLGLAGQAQSETPPAPVKLADLDFDLGSSVGQPMAPGGAGDPGLETTIAFPKPGDGNLLDFDLTTSLPRASTTPADEDSEGTRLIDDASSLEVTMLVASQPQRSAPRTDSGLEFEFDLGTPSPDEPPWEARTLTQAAPYAARDVASTPAEALEFDVELADSNVGGEGMQHPAFDLSSISLDLAQADTLTAGATPPISGALDFSFEAEQEDTLVNPIFAPEATDSELNPDFGEATEFVISSNEEVATKLDLARAYQEMGDLEGARELLQEVVNEGDAEQREAALTLLSGLRE